MNECPIIKTIVILWGQEYTDYFVNILFPLAVNAGLLSYSKDSLELYCSPCVKGRLNHRQVNYYVCIPDEGGYKYGVISDIAKKAIKDHASGDYILLFLSPDMVCAGNMFHRVRQVFADGHDAIVMPCFRSDKAAFPYHHYTTTRELVRCSLSHLHPISAGSIYDSYHESWSSCLYFKAEHGMIGHQWHWHPLAVRADMVSEVNGTIDYDLIAKSSVKDKGIYYVTDSDDMFAVELSTVTTQMPTPALANPQSIKDWAARFTTPFDKTLFRKTIIWHYSDIDDDIESTIVKANQFIDKILDHEVA